MRKSEDESTEYKLLDSALTIASAITSSYNIAGDPSDIIAVCDMVHVSDIENRIEKLFIVNSAGATKRIPDKDCFRRFARMELAGEMLNAAIIYGVDKKRIATTLLECAKYAAKTTGGDGVLTECISAANDILDGTLKFHSTKISTILAYVRADVKAHNPTSIDFLRRLACERVLALANNTHLDMSSFMDIAYVCLSSSSSLISEVEDDGVIKLGEIFRANISVSDMLMAIADR